MDENQNEEIPSNAKAVASLYTTAILLGTVIGIGHTVGREGSKAALAKIKSIREKRNPKSHHNIVK